MTLLAEPRSSLLPPPTAPIERVVGEAAPIVASDAESALVRSFLAMPRGLLLAGRLARTGRCGDRLREVAERFSLPVMTTLAAKGVLDERHPLSFGSIGGTATCHGVRLWRDSRKTNLLPIGCDFSAVGMVEGEAIATADGRPVSPLSETLGGAEADASGASLLEAMLALGSDAVAAAVEARRAWVAEMRSGPRVLESTDMPPPDTIALHRFVGLLADHWPPDSILFSDAGLTRAYLGHFWQARSPAHFHSMPQSAPMGWALAAGVGSALADPRRTSLVVIGDGSMRMLGTELATAARYQAPVKVLLSENGMLGNVFLRVRDNSVAAAELSVSGAVDWVSFSHSLGVPARRATNIAEYEEGLQWLHRAPGPALLVARTAARSLSDLWRDHDERVDPNLAMQHADSW